MKRRGLLALPAVVALVAACVLLGGGERPIVGGLAYAIAASPSGDLLAAGGSDEALVLLKPNGELVRRIPTGGTNVLAVAFSPRGDLVASASIDGRIRVYRVSDAGTAHEVDEGRGFVEALAFSPSGEHLVWGTRGAIVVMDLAAKTKKEVPVATGEVESLAFSENRLLAAAGRAALLFSFPEMVLATEIRRDVHAACFASGGIALGSQGKLELYSLDGKLASERQIGYEIRALATNGTVVAAGTDSGVFVVGPEARVRVLAQGEGRVTAVAFMPDGKRLVSTGWDGLVQVRGVD